MLYSTLEINVVLHFSHIQHLIPLYLAIEKKLNIKIINVSNQLKIQRVIALCL
jgi:hypothetical protein